MVSQVVISLALMAFSLATVRAQAPPPPELLTASKSGVLPVVPTPFNGVETIEGAIVYDGPPVPGFTGPGGNATVQSNLPSTCYQAMLPNTNFDNLTGSLILGSITGSSVGTGVSFSVNFTGFPSEAEYGPFVYHIHGLPVPADGNCSATLGHLDPTNRGELYSCDVANPQSCQAGDLAGKHGNITGTSFTAQYTDLYLSTVPGSQYFFGDKSVVVHATNTTRLTCANFVQVPCAAGGGAGAGNSTGSNATVSVTVPTGAPTASASPTPYTGEAARFGSFSSGLAGLLLLGLAGVLML